MTESKLKKNEPPMKAADGEPGGILCLHLGGGSIGWCCGSSTFGLWRLPADGDHGMLGAATVDALADVTKVMQPRAIAVSGPPNEVETIQPDIAVLHVGLLMCVRVFGFRRRIAVTVPDLAAVRGKILGRADLPPAKAKVAALSFLKRRGITGVDSAVAHAMVLWHHQTEIAG